jgi:hypothetical protein
MVSYEYIQGWIGIHADRGYSTATNASRRCGARNKIENKALDAAMAACGSPDSSKRTILFKLNQN